MSSRIVRFREEQQRKGVDLSQCNRIQMGIDPLPASSKFKLQLPTLMFINNILTIISLSQVYHRCVILL